jgi:ubiquinone/menaquinone biosynthesis C-methylase UbiE
MPAMSALEQAFCRSPVWGAFTQRVVLPWAIGGADLAGEVLELGSGGGAMGTGLLAQFPSISLTATDVDPAMLDSARRRLAPFGDRVEFQEADATRLPFPDGRFDAVVCFAMLHHVIDWERALGEVARVLRPGGQLVGYDVVMSGPARVLHRFDRSPHRLATLAALRARLGELPFDAPRVEPGLRGLVARFTARRSSETRSSDG